MVTATHGLSPQIHGLARVADTSLARLRAVGERLKQLGVLRVAVLLYEPRHVVVREPVAGSAYDRQARQANVGQGERAVARTSIGPSLRAGQVLPCVAASLRPAFGGRRNEEEGHLLVFQHRREGYGAVRVL